MLEVSNEFFQKSKISILAVGIPLSFLAMKFYMRLPLTLSIIVPAVMGLVILLSFALEKRSDRQFDKLKKSIKNGEHHYSEEWQEKYSKFVESKGYEQIKHISMTADLSARYMRPTGVFMIMMGIGTIILGIIFLGEANAVAILSLFGLGFCAYGVYCLMPPNVMRFLKNCGDDLSNINDSYMNGSLLTFKKKISDKYCNDGLNIGSTHLILFTPKRIAALKYVDIERVSPRILRTKYYANSVYTCSDYKYYIDIFAKRHGIYSIQLSEFQTVLAFETLKGRVPYTEWHTDNRSYRYK